MLHMLYGSPGQLIDTTHGPNVTVSLTDAGYPGQSVSREYEDKEHFVAFRHLVVNLPEHCKL